MSSLLFFLSYQNKTICLSVSLHLYPLIINVSALFGHHCLCMECVLFWWYIFIYIIINDQPSVTKPNQPICNGEGIGFHSNILVPILTAKYMNITTREGRLEHSLLINRFGAETQIFSVFYSYLVDSTEVLFIQTTQFRLVTRNP